MTLQSHGTNTPALPTYGGPERSAFSAAPPWGVALLPGLGDQRHGPDIMGRSTTGGVSTERTTAPGIVCESRSPAAVSRSAPTRGTSISDTCRAQHLQVDRSTSPILDAGCSMLDPPPVVDRWSLDHPPAQGLWACGRAGVWVCGLAALPIHSTSRSESLPRPESALRPHHSWGFRRGGAEMRVSLVI